MNTGKIKVFHGLVNYGTQAGFLARELRNKGIEANAVTRYDPFERVTDVPLKHSGANLFQKLYNVIWNQLYLVYCFFKYDVFHFYAGDSLARSQWDLPLYRLFGKKVVFEYLGIDVQKYRYSVEKFKYTNITYLVEEERAEEHDRSIDQKLAWHEKYADLQLVCAPCYSPFVKGSSVLPLGIDLSEYSYTPMAKDREKVKIMHAPTHRGNKGTTYIIDAIDRLIEEGYPVEKMLVENVSHSELKEMYKDCDLFVDQIMGGWYGTASIEAMALGRPVVCSIYREFTEYVEYGNRIPIVNADPDTIYKVLKKMIKDRPLLSIIGMQGYDFVREVHDVKRNTEYLSHLYERIIDRN